MKALDFRAFEQKTWEIVLPDEKGTTLHLTAPTEDLVEKLSVNLPQLQEVFKERNDAMLDKAYDLAADFMSCNTEGLTITGEDLRKVYGFKLVYMAAFFTQYVEFIGEINNAKN